MQVPEGERRGGGVGAWGAGAVTKGPAGVRDASLMRGRSRGSAATSRKHLGVSRQHARGPQADVSPRRQEAAPSGRVTGRREPDPVGVAASGPGGSSGLSSKGEVGVSPGFGESRR